MDLFPTRIYVHQTILDDFKEVNEQAQWLARKVEQNGYQKHPGWERDTHSLSDPTFQENVLKKYRCYKIQQKITELVQAYLQQLGHNETTISGFDITGSWLTKTAPGEYARLHHHGQSDISGVYYIESNVQKSGNIYFQNHDPIKSSTLLHKEVGSQHDMSPAKGSFLLFPGWLLHGTRINEHDEDRISLSFNINLFTK